MRFLSFAKINLHLEVLRRREDGFHELRTVFQTIDLAYEIELLPRDHGIALTIAGAPGLAADESNLAWRAAAGFLSRWGRVGEGVEIRLSKRIPLGGGLGGGAPTPRRFWVAWPFCSTGDPLWRSSPSWRRSSDRMSLLPARGTALGTGRGELITALPDPAAPPLDLWLAVPPVAAETKRVFAAHRLAPDRAGSAPSRPSEAPGGAPGDLLPTAWSDLFGSNDLEPTCLALYPQVRAVYNQLSESGAAAVRLSGSGSTIFALFADRAAGQAAGDRLDNDTIWLPVKTLSRIEWLSRSGLGVLSGGS
jgi:4-diphosphocytidyl-2-C-methyl-D-erythritol kinase